MRGQDFISVAHLFLGRVIGPMLASALLPAVHQPLPPLNEVFSPASFAAPWCSAELWQMMTILTVDDNEKIRRLIRALLTPFADTVAECGDGADAVEAYRVHQPHLVLMDIKMPRLDGLSATRQLLAKFPNARILILTEDATEAVRAAAIAAGARGIVLKRNLNRLESAVRAGLG